MNRSLLALLLLASALLSGACVCLRPPRPPKSPPIVLKDASGEVVSELQLHDSLLVELSDLEPRQGYDVTVADLEGRVMVANRLSTDALGRVPETVLWYSIGALPCWQGEGALIDTTLADRTYTLTVAREGRVVRSTSFRVAAELTRPVLFAADARGCPKTGFLIGEEDVWVVGRHFPAGSLLRLWAVPEDSDWRDGEPLTDRTSQWGYQMPPLIELAPGQTEFRRRLWPRGLTSLGKYDIVAEVVAYPFGTYRTNPVAEAQDVVSHRSFSGFVVQRRPGAAEPLEMDVAGSTASPFSFRSAFLTHENVFVGVDPLLQPSFLGQTADVYIVAARTDAQWTVNTSLADVTGTIEQITVNGICGNCWNTLAWAAPLAVGEYDVVLDFNHDGLYTAGTDLIDALDPVGFTVADLRVDTISFNYPGSGAIQLYDHVAAANVTVPEYVSAGQASKPAAWVMGGGHSVRVRFAAGPAITTAQVWAEGGLGGLGSAGSPVTVNFTGGFGEATFPVNTPPAAVARTLFTWDWKYLSGLTTLTLGHTGQHRLYTVLASPQAPQAVPWVGALEVATQLAQGTTTAAAATRAIWQDFYTNAGGLYDTVSGASAYTGGTTTAFNLTQWLANYSTASIGVVNCYDMGKSVVVFANALGAGTEYVYTNPFGYLNLINAIGRGWTNNPFYDSFGCDPSPIVPGDNDRCGFGNHAFTLLAGQIYDGSGGQVDADADPDDAPAGTPRDLDGDDSWNASYRTRVIDNLPVSSPGTPTVYAFTVY